MRAPLLFADRTRFLRRPEATIPLGECKVLARSHPPPISSPLKYKNIPDKKGKEEKNSIERAIESDGVDKIRGYDDIDREQ